MANYTDVPTIPLLYLRPAKASFDVVGSGMDGGVNGLGEGISIETSGGGMVVASYERLMLEADDTARHEVVSWIGARGNGGFRFFNVPFITDGFGPFPFINGKRRAQVTSIFAPDGSLLSDGTSSTVATVFGEVLENAAVGAGLLRMRVFDAARDLRWADWFSIYHSVKGWRAYRYWNVVAITGQGSMAKDGAVRTFKDYTLAINPTLRQAVTAGTRVELARPLCVMKFPRGFTLPFDYEGWYSSRPSLSFVEAF